MKAPPGIQIIESVFTVCCEAVTSPEVMFSSAPARVLKIASVFHGSVAPAPDPFGHGPTHLVLSIWSEPLTDRAIRTNVLGAFAGLQWIAQVFAKGALNEP